MKQVNRVMMVLCVLLSWHCAWGQIQTSVRGFVIDVSDTTNRIPAALMRTTNYNPSVFLGDSVLFFVHEGLRMDKDATIVTVYETEEDDVAGLWEIGTHGNRALWLNTHRASYDNFSVSYRDTTEKGVIIHTMLYRYPAVDSGYNGHDTLFVGREGTLRGDKNLCTLLYYPGIIGLDYRRKVESALAIRYGALLHGAYLNSRADTLWNPIGVDSAYSAWVCGIGRDDSLALLQPKSRLRNGILAIESEGNIPNLTHVMLGSDGGSTWLGGEVVVNDGVAYSAVSRHWRLRAHSNEDSIAVRISADMSMPTGAVRLMVATDSSGKVYAPTSSDSIVFDSVVLAVGRDYSVALLVAPQMRSKGGFDKTMDTMEGGTVAGALSDAGTPVFTVSPNPTLGSYTVDVELPKADFVDIQVHDAQGRLVGRSVTAERQTRHMYAGQLTTCGTYYVTVGNSDHQKTVKLIVVK